MAVTGIDNLNNYYSQQLKEDRLKNLGFLKGDDGKWKREKGNSSFFKIDLKDATAINRLFAENQFDYVIQLAAQAGVRYSLKDPHAYVDSNITGFLNILEACRHHPVKHLIFASSSSVYGLNQTIPYSEKNSVDHPASMYAATKKSNEMMAHTYSHLFNIPVTGLRFFTVYGPWGRPDMASFLFTDKILKGQPIDVYNYGKMKRDFTYIDDIVEGVVRLIEKPPLRNENWSAIDTNPDLSTAPYRIFNIGNNSPVPLEEFISTLEEILGKKAERNYLPLQQGDVIETYANIDALSAATGFRPTISIREGLKKFVDWYKEYYK